MQARSQPAPTAGPLTAAIERERNPLDVLTVIVPHLHRRAREQALPRPHVLDVSAGTKSRARPRQNDGGTVRIGIDARTGVDELLEMRRFGQRIALFRPHHGQDRDPVPFFHLQKGHPEIS
jgi:hypothetical protein